MHERADPRHAATAKCGGCSPSGRTSPRTLGGRPRHGRASPYCASRRGPAAERRERRPRSTLCARGANLQRPEITHPRHLPKRRELLLDSRGPCQGTPSIPPDVECVPAHGPLQELWPSASSGWGPTCEDCSELTGTAAEVVEKQQPGRTCWVAKHAPTVTSGEGQLGSCRCRDDGPTIGALALPPNAGREASVLLVGADEAVLVDVVAVGRYALSGLPGTVRSERKVGLRHVEAPES